MARRHSGASEQAPAHYLLSRLQVQVSLNGSVGTFGATAMSLPNWLPDWVTPALELERTQQFGLAFLLGSFTVATWSDLKRLSAQREFVEIWLVFTLAMLGYEVWSVHVGGMPLERVAVKWGLIMLASILSVVGVLFRLAS